MASALLLTSPAAAQTTPNEAPDQVFPLDVTINGAAGGIWPILRREGVIYAPAEAFTRWRLEMRPGSPSMAYRGLTYFAVSSVPGMEGRINEAAATLELKVPADLFAATKLSRDAAPDTVSISPVVPTAYFNYDLSYIRSSARTGPTLNTLGMLGEAGFSSGLGVFTQTFSTRNESNSESSVTRLETTYRRDFPGRGLTLTVGDATLRTGLLGRNAYFGGLQIGTNFALSPLTNRQPVPLITGQAAAPSMVQLYVNDILRQTSQVPAGPFSLDNLPVLTGNGQVTVVVRDILGRETLLTQPFLITADLLAPGLSDWSVEAGKLRLDMGLKNASYADTFVSGMWRRGMTTNWTLETRAESTRDRTSVGAATLNAFGSNWLARAGWMGTHDQRAGSGSRWLVGVDYPGFDRNAAVTLEGATRRYRSLGELPELDPVRMQLAGQGTWLFGDLGRLGVALAIQKREILPQRTSLSFNYSKTFRENWQFNAYFTRTMGITSGTTAGVLLSIPLGRRVSSSHSVQVRHKELDVYSSVTGVPEGSTGLAWRALAAYQGRARAEGGLYYLSDHGQTSADLSVSEDATNLRLGAVGGLLFSRGRVFATPRFDSAAVLVEVPGYPNVGVGVGGRTTARTDSQGFALVSRLFPYQSNAIRLDPNDLPFSAEVDSIELDAVPAWRSVAGLTFTVRGGRGALIRIVMDDGEPAPAGAIVRIGNEERDFYVARRGEAYVTGLQASNRLKLRWRDRQCEFDVTLPPGSADDIARVGPVACAGVPR